MDAYDTERLRKAKEVARATEWVGDMRVNFHTAIKAASLLADRVDELERVIHTYVQECEEYETRHQELIARHRDDLS